MDPFESLLKAAQQIDSPNFNVKVVVEMKQQQRSLPSQTTTIRPTQLLSTPPRPSASSSAAAATMPPPPPPPRVQLAHHNPISNSSSVLAMPSLYSPYAAPAQYFNYYAAAAAAGQSLGSFGPPTLATAAMMMTPPSSSSPSSSWPYYHLNPRFSGHSQEQFVVPPAPAVGHLPHPATVAAAQPLCLFPSTTQAAAQASCQGMANPPPVAAAAAASATTSAFRPIAERPFLPGANNMTFVSPVPKKSRRSCSSRHSVTTAATAAPVAFLELKPSAQDDAPPEEEADAAAAATTPATATTKMRIAVTPDAEVNNKNQDAADDEDDEEEEEEFDAISTSTAWPVDENITLPALFDNEDKPFVNPTHYIIGSEILEPFVIPRYHEDAPAAAAASASTQKKKNKQVKKRKKKKINFRAGTIAFRCRFCKHSPNKNEAPLATIYPETVGGLYRANLRFQAGHLNKCENCPAEVKERLENAQRSGDRRPYEVQVGVRRYWISTAVRKGFRNVTVKGKERLGFAPPVLQEY
eukprot:CAMPEP_0113387766 /NCGR_PEP_ID=MMETSP0013_2-20120614/8721_1 /TAXON_ID=2843 ORGANISM="Skeletonema costatum, Strain 1716" /NCGR_SAMPLE_ID=MMETSP0013_2 /ASSEMBLY_ACC=CAM_ASM_000158 /LENGTH=523 /DNA_ID=CAMNT_0000270703 /DNA_START=125 /DNA_END=1696 /DNA_ORIENTATION=+ /assembly_acc=CAM_ASM_000158